MNPPTNDSRVYDDVRALGPYAEHLRILSICHYALAGIVGLFSLLPVIHLVVGLGIVTGAIGPLGSGKGPPDLPGFFGWIFVFFGGACVSGGMSLAACIGFAGHFLATHRRYLFCLVVAGLSCLFTPLGTILGVFTLVTLTRPEVKAAFER